MLQFLPCLLEHLLLKPLATLQQPCPEATMLGGSPSQPRQKDPMKQPPDGWKGERCPPNPDVFQSPLLQPLTLSLNCPAELFQIHNLCKSLKKGDHSCCMPYIFGCSVFNSSNQNTQIMLLSPLTHQVSTKEVSCLIYPCCLVAKSNPTLCNPMDCSPPGSSDHGFCQSCASL